LYFLGGESTYRIADASSTNRNSGLAYTDGGLALNLALTASNTYSLNTGSSVVTGTLAPGGPIAWLEFFNNNAGLTSARNVYFGEMSHLVSITGSGTNEVTAAITRTAGAADSDGDGFTDDEELALGTNPSDASSRFAVHEAAHAGGTIAVTWSSVPGKTYRLQARPSLTEGSWQDVGDEITATGATTSTTHTASGQHFYRARLVP
jgi:hypothetical protein